MDLKLKDHVVVNEAMGKKSNMDGDQLTDFDKTELRTKSQIGCPNNDDQWVLCTAFLPHVCLFSFNFTP